MKALFTGCVFILLYACGNSNRVELPVIKKPDYLHDIAPFTSDSLVNVVIEIPAGSNQKWEVNKATGQIEWELVTPDSFRVINYLPYPANYGFVPQTLLPGASGGDGDPVDVFILGPSTPREGIFKVRIVGVIHTLDDNETDIKLLAVDVDKPYLDINTYDMLVNDYPGVIEIIKIWLSNYKGAGRVKILSVNDETDAIRLLKRAHIDYIEQKNK